MNCYVLGAGVSTDIGYPLGSKVFEELEKHVKTCKDCQDRQCRGKSWQDVTTWLNHPENPLIERAFRDGKCHDIEYLFTILDLAYQQHLAPLRAVFNHNSTNGWSNPEKLDDYPGYREVLLETLAHYFLVRHVEDNSKFNDAPWETLKRFGEILEDGDVIITFNYDAAIERVLLTQNKWSIADGYGFEVAVENANNSSQKTSSKIKVLHLHGMTGWYRAKHATDTVPKISVAPEFLLGLGISGKGQHKADLEPNPQLMLHPTYLKDLEDKLGSTALIDLWQQAAEKLRQAKRVYIIGYSLPKADAAALTLLLTNCDRKV